MDWSQLIIFIMVMIEGGLPRNLLTRILEEPLLYTFGGSVTFQLQF